MKATNVKWFSSLTGQIGIVLGEDDVTKEKKAYIGKVDGLSEGQDIHKIMELGAKFPAEIAELLMK